MSPYAEAGSALAMDARMAEDAAPPSRARRQGGVGIFCASFEPPFAAHRISPREAHRGRAVATGRSVAMGTATGDKCDNCNKELRSIL